MDSKQQRQWVTWIIVALLIAGTAYLGIKYPVPGPPDDEVVELGTTHFTNLEAEDIAATDDLAVTDDASVGGDLTVIGAGSFATVTGSGTTDVGTFLNLSKQATIAVGAGGIITPTGTYQPITSTAYVTTSTTIAVYTHTNTGDFVILCNENASDIIVIDDGANTTLGGDKVLTGGQGDCVTLLWDGTDWTATGYNDN